MLETTTELIIGIAFGLVLGIGPAVAVGLLGAVGDYRGSTLPRSASIAAALPLAALNAAAVGMLDLGSLRMQAPRLAIGSVVVVLLALYATSQGKRVASELPLGATRPVVRKCALSGDAIDSVDAMGQVTIHVTGRIRDIDGYPSPSPDLREVLEVDSWQLPADLPLVALETRLAARLRTEYDLAAVSVSIDRRGRATIAAAPSSGGNSTAVPDGWRAVSVAALLPTGVAPGDEIEVHACNEAVQGTILSIGRNDSGSTNSRTGSDLATEHGCRSETDTGQPAETGGRTGVGSPIVLQRPDPEADGGNARVTVAVPAGRAGALLTADRCRIIVPASTPDADREALSRLEQADYSVRHARVGEIGMIPESTDEASDLRALAATRRSDTGVDGTAAMRMKTAAERDQWTIDPGEKTLEAGDEVFVVGPRAAVKRHLDDDCETRPGATATPELEGES
ncbi:hypothetical protein [Natrinema sp. SYSU A 869]|uniref:hypothetical protein n=1 Tax=Natrinema sp. SYSU A 869 TaxID=2871694 RepID=UPI001CA3AA7C|nr:hypothetical protein [Natrinema sp. SYSU A 869]